jgi:hypothetical protein
VNPAPPVIDPVAAAFKLAEALVDLGLTPSTRTYAPPVPKKVVGYDRVVEAVAGRRGGRSGMTSQTAASGSAGPG